MRQVVVTGIGAVSAFGASAAAFRDALLDGRSGIAPVTAFATADCRSTLAAPVAGFEPAQWIPPIRLRRMDPTGALAVVAVRQAIEDAGYPQRPEGDDHAGVVFGTYSAGGHATSEYLQGLFRGGPAAASALLFNSTVGNAAASLAGLEFKLRGPNTTISQKEGSGLAAIVTATELLRHERAVGLAAGGIDAINEPFFKAHDRFRVMAAASRPSDVRGPFDRARSGFVMGEGAFALWLERADRAQARGARPYGEILGVGSAGAAVPLNQWPDRTEPLVRTMRLALEDAGTPPADIHVVYASANGTQALDAIEAAALGELFGAGGPVVTSIKGAIGEFGASGAASVVAALLCGREGRVPPVVGFHEADQGNGELRIAAGSAPAAGPLVLVNSFASGGALFSAVIRVNA